MISPVKIREWSETALPLLQRLMGDPEMMVHLGGPETPEQIEKRHQRYLDLSDKGRMYVILVGSEETSAGSVGYWEKDWQGQIVWETGWSVLPEFQGKGIATRATALIVESLQELKLHRFLHAYPSVDNAASNAICRKLGFELTGDYDFEYPKGHWMRCNDWQLNLFAAIKANKAPAHG